MADPNKEPEEVKDPPEKKPEEITPPVEPDPEPQPRRSAASHIIERKDKKIDELSKDKDDPGAGDDDGELTPDAQTAIEREVQKQITPIQAGQRQTIDEQEIQDVLNSHKEDEIQVPGEVLRKYVNSPASGTMSIEFIHQGLQNEYIKRAKAKKDAEDEAAGGNLAGKQRRPGSTGKLPDFSQMDDAEFEEWDKKNREE